MKMFKCSLLLISILSVLVLRAQKGPLNVIVILTDDQGYADVGFNGSVDIPTPNMDRIAANGAVFTQGYVSYSVCGPSRAGLITGRYQDRFGFSRNPLLAPNDPEMGLPRSEETMAAFLKRAGYTTGAVGKWHLGAHKSLRPLERGFDEFFGFLSGGHRYFPEEYTLNDLSQARDQWDGYLTKILRNNKRIEETQYLTDAFSREASNFVRKYKDTSFFLYLAYNAPHAPLQAPIKYLNRFLNIKDEKRRTYSAMVSAVDDGIGRLLDNLDELGLTDNTLIFFLSDNGGPDNNGSSNEPLRGFKGSFFEGGVRVPFAVQWPDQIPANTIYDKPVISLDIFGTVASLVKVKPKKPLDGVNLLPFLKNGNTSAPHANLFWATASRDRLAVRGDIYKSIFEEGSSDLLFNLNMDLKESTNLSDSDPEKLDVLKSNLDNWKDQMQVPVFLGLLEDKEYSLLHPERWKIVED